MSSPVQLDLFAGIEPANADPSPRDYRPDPADVRAELLNVLDEARKASVVPWDARRTRYWRTVFPQMSNCLRGEEAAQLRAEFAAELRRLQAA